MMHYVVGFVFSPNKSSVLLILKDRPKWQAGRYNGIGGKVEEGELTSEAMARECKEETGLDLEMGEWREFCMLKTKVPEECYVTFLMATSDKIYHAKKMESEEPRDFQLNGLPVNMIPNLNWLIPMALDKDRVFASVVERYN